MEPEYSEQGYAVGAYVIYRSLLHWRIFETKEKEELLPRLAESIRHSIQKKKDQTKSGLMHYLAILSFLASLLHQLAREKHDVNVNARIKGFEKEILDLVNLTFSSLASRIHVVVESIMVPAILPSDQAG